MNELENKLRSAGWVQDKAGGWSHPSRSAVGGSCVATDGLVKCFHPSSSKRIRQSSKPIMNKLEQEWFDIVERRHMNAQESEPRAQAIRFKLANGVSYTPDVFCFGWPPHTEPTAWEVKGNQAWDDAIVKLKVAAYNYREIKWILVWKENGEWKEQLVRP